MNAFQLFAARYQIRRLRVQFVDDADNILRKHLSYVNPERYNEVFAAEIAAEQQPLTMAGRPVEEVVEDLDEYDEYFAGLEEKRFLTGGEILAMSDSEGGWI